jgi:hypothetical protein
LTGDPGGDAGAAHSGLTYTDRLTISDQQNIVKGQQFTYIADQPFHL